MSDDPKPGFMDDLSFTDAAAEAPPRPSGDVMVTRSVKLPVELDARIKRAAADRGVPQSTLIREWLAQALAVLDGDELISRADALRALAGLHTPPGAAA